MQPFFIDTPKLKGIKGKRSPNPSSAQSYSPAYIKDLNDGGNYYDIVTVE